MTLRQPQPGRREAAARIPFALADATRRSVDRETRHHAGHRRHGARQHPPGSAQARIRQAVSGVLTAIRPRPGHPDHRAAGSLLTELVACPPGPGARRILSLAGWQVLAAEDRRATDARRQTLRQLEQAVREPGRRHRLAGLIERILPASSARLHVSTDRNDDAVQNAWGNALTEQTDYRPSASLVRHATSDPADEDLLAVLLIMDWLSQEVWRNLAARHPHHG